MSEYGLKLKNIKAGSLYGYNINVRDKYDYTEAMFNNSLFNDYIVKNGLSVWKEESTRDIICLDFGFGSRSYEEEVEQITKKINDPKNEDKKEIYEKVLEIIESNKDKFNRMTVDEIRDLFYVDGVDVEYITKDRKTGEIKKKQVISYKMLYRNSSKAKIGQVIFINKKLYKKAYNWLTMGLGNKLPKNNAKIVEMSAYAPLTTSTIIDRIHIPIEDILILKDQDSFFKTLAKVVKSEDYEVEIKVLDEEKTEINRLKAIENNNFDESGNPKFKRKFKKIKEIRKKCIVVNEETNVKNTMWDGMSLIESSILPSYINGMALFRNHFFKSCAFKSYLQLFFKDWCLENNLDYLTYEVEDMFGVKHKLKDIKMITTNNSIKWQKFSELMGKTELDAYNYWCDKINEDGSIFGIVKTDHPSKLGEVQQLSYQMINTLPCTKEDIKELASTSVNYVELIKSNNAEFEKFLRINANEINHYEMMADLYKHNIDFANSQWFRIEKSQVIRNYVDRLRKGKITVNADNLTICGNPYGLLLYTVGEDWNNDKTLIYEKGTIQCYTTRFKNDEYLCGIRNPQNSPNNICYLHNVYSECMDRYFDFSDNILAVNCIGTDVQDRTNSADFDLKNNGSV